MKNKIHFYSCYDTEKHIVIKILGIKFKIRKINTKNNLVKNDSGIHKRNTSEFNTKLYVENLHTTHKEVFPQFKNINLGKEVVIIGTGPTLAKYQPIENTVNIGLNRAYQYDKVKLEYLFLQDGIATHDYIDEVDKITDTVKFFGLRLFNETFRDNFRISEDHLCFENSYRYFMHNYNDCDLNSNIKVYPLFSSGSVSLSALHFALWTQPSKIYLVGCDTDASPYFDGRKRDDAYLERAQVVNEKIIDGYKRMKDFASVYYPKTEIVSINPVGLKGLFKDIYQGDCND